MKEKNADKVYVYSEQVWNELINDCKGYIANERVEYDDCNGGMADSYQKELDGLTVGDWEAFVNTGIWHDAIGKLAYYTDTEVGVWTEY